MKDLNQCLSVRYIIDRRVSGNQDQNLVRVASQIDGVNRQFRTNRSPESTGLYAEERKPHGVEQSNPSPSRVWADVPKPHRRKMESVLAGGYVGYQ
ncbi:MAG: hypothetical protein JO279_03060 [Verrucomicrobia bacterium]|nr:hypothetical protein [Verrucomicrobiota bacterium]